MRGELAELDFDELMMDENGGEDDPFADGQQPAADYDPSDPLAVDGAAVPVRFLTGQAGTGKTYTVRERIAAAADFGILCSTTGISAINLGAGVTTINSLLAYYDTESMRERYKEGRLNARLLQRVVKEGYRNIVVDEASMMPAEQLQILYNAVAHVNQLAVMRERGRKLGLILTGDFAQLAPVADKDAAGRALPTPWGFLADCWDEFDARTYKLTDVKRQTDAGFLAAINAARAGRGGEAAEGFAALGVEMDADGTADDFNGTTILATNEAVDRYNDVRVMDLLGKTVRPPVERWGLQKAEWKKNVPNCVPGRGDKQAFKIGAYVMVLANSYSAPGVLSYANGDCGWIRDCVFSKSEKRKGEAVFVVELKRGPVVEVPAVTRLNTQKERPDAGVVEVASWIKHPMYPAPFKEDKKWAVGGVTYFPLRYAYASTVFKSQGLTLDSCQIDLRPHFLGSPNQCYVAISRCRTAEGLRLVGTKDLLVKRCNVAPEVKKWL